MTPEAMVRARRRIGDLCARCIDSVAFRKQIRSVLHDVIRFDGFCINTADPQTLLVTGSVGDGMPLHLAQRLFEIEYHEDDYSKLAALAVSDTGVAVLGHETGSKPERSARMRDVLMPLGYRHELRCALRLRNACWGYLHLFRAGAGPDFSTPEGLVVQTLCPEIARGLRTCIARGSLARGSLEGPGVVLLSSDGDRIDSMNTRASEWIAELHGELSDPLPHGILAAAQSSRRPSRAGAGSAPARAQTRTGEWITIWASVVGSHLIVLMDRARPQDLTAILLDAHGLSRREQEIVTCLVRGMSNDEIAASLHISTYTVKDHFKSIFAKLEVQTRSELAARMSLESDTGSRFARPSAAAGQR